MDSTRSLGIFKQNMLKFSITRMDIVFWKNIVSIDASPQVIAESMSLEFFKKLYDDRSLFHHFSDSLEIIDAFTQ